MELPQFLCSFEQISSILTDNLTAWNFSNRPRSNRNVAFLLLLYGPAREEPLNSFVTNKLLVKISFAGLNNSIFLTMMKLLVNRVPQHPGLKSTLPRCCIDGQVQAGECICRGQRDPNEGVDYTLSPQWHQLLIDWYQ